MTNRGDFNFFGTLPDRTLQCGSQIIFENGRKQDLEPTCRFRLDSSTLEATSAEPRREIERSPEGIGRGLLVLLMALAPALAAIWTVRWFVTQDGPAHIYNAQILAWSFHNESPFREVYAIRWQPIPNWAGHLLLAGLVAILPAWLADRLMTSVTLVGFAAAVLWMRWQVARGRDSRPAAVLAALLAMNISWLFGFTSFMLGDMPVSDHPRILVDVPRSVRRRAHHGAFPCF